MQGNRNTLLVAHNAVNQALVATAIGLPPTYFRRLLQNNAATTVLDFQPNGDGPPRVNLDRLNQVSLHCCSDASSVQSAFAHRLKSGCNCPASCLCCVVSVLRVKLELTHISSMMCC